MKKYILKGNDAEVDKVVRENRIRVARGMIEFTPCDEESPEPSDDDEVPEPSDDGDLNSGEGENVDMSEQTHKTLLEPLNGPEESTADVPNTDSKDVKLGDTKDVPGEDVKGKQESKPKGRNK